MHTKLNALHEQLEHQRELVRVMRDSMKPMDVLWEERIKLEESSFALTSSTQIAPKQHEVSVLQKELRQLEEECAAKKSLEYGKIFEKLQQQEEEQFNA